MQKARGGNAPRLPNGVDDDSSHQAGDSSHQAQAERAERAGDAPADAPPERAPRTRPRATPRRPTWRRTGARLGGGLEADSGKRTGGGPEAAPEADRSAPLAPGRDLRALRARVADLEAALGEVREATLSPHPPPTTHIYKYILHYIRKSCNITYTEFLQYNLL